jgi:hypothetical protein
MSKSPFPGVDPYLEPAWRDVHHSLCTYARDEIQAQLGNGLLARIDERLVVEQVPSRERSVYGDVRVVQGTASKATRSSTPAGIALAEPITVEIADEVPSEGFIEIIDVRSGGRVITVIEFLSPTNKLADAGRDQYRRKRVELQEAGVSLVEINLVRAGGFAAPFPEAMLEPESRTPYYAVVHRGWTGRKFQFYPMPLAERMPAIAIPLREADADVALDIQLLIDRVYQNGAYDQEIDYTADPKPPLEANAAEWASRLLKEAGLR